ncbi:hypothetical protein [Maricaulis sp.]|uniref:hypothetical protein n=1 Tax=Maricaulis sp. TaxID=1486257 RepID=UPI003A94BFD8
MIETTRLADHTVTGLLLAQLVLPLFFSVQIALVWAGAEAFTASPERVRSIVDETPVPALVAPFLRVGLVLAMLCTHRWLPAWTLPLLICSIAVHVVGWTAIIGNPYFKAPTGYITLMLQSALLILMLLNPALRQRRA